MDDKTIKRFWSKVDRRGPTECWNWLASKNSKGYGHFGIGCKIHSAHRIAYEIANNDPLLDRWALHHCDNRSCVNPNHLYAGTRSDNINDAVARKRFVSRRGEKSTRAVISDIEALFIKYWLDSKYKTMEIAKTFGVGYGVVYNIDKKITRAYL